MLGSFKYRCYLVSKGLGEVLLKESNEMLKDLSDGVREVTVKISQVIVDGGNVTWYKFQVKLERVFHGTSHVMRFCCHRRFRDFRYVYTQVCSAYRGTHLLSSIPKPPSRQLKLLEDHFDTEFLETRRVELESWLRRTLLVPRVSCNPDMELFLGMADISMREISIAIESGSLGLRLKKRIGGLVSGSSDRFHETYPQAIVDGYMRGEDNIPGVAEASGLVGIGDVISKVNGESVVNMSYEAIVPLLKHSRKPMIIHFLGSTLARSSNDLKIVAENNFVEELDSFLGDSPKTASPAISDSSMGSNKSSVPVSLFARSAVPLRNPTPVQKDSNTKEISKVESTPKNDIIENVSASVIDDKILNDAPIDDIVLDDDAPIDEIVLDDDAPIDDIVLNDAPIDDIVLNDAPIDDIVLDDASTDDIVLDDAPTDDLLEAKQTVDLGISKQPIDIAAELETDEQHIEVPSLETDKSPIVSSPPLPPKRSTPIEANAYNDDDLMEDINF